MFEKRTSIIPLRCLVAILLLGMILTSCSPTSTPAPPAVTVTWTPDVSDVGVGQKIAFVVETENQNIQLRWNAVDGTLSASEGSAVIYTAPDTEGVDIVTLEASNDGGTTVEHISFNIVARPIATPTPTPTDTPVPQTTQLEITGIICKPNNDPVDMDGNKVFLATRHFDRFGNDQSGFWATVINPQTGDQIEAQIIAFRDSHDSDMRTWDKCDFALKKTMRLALKDDLDEVAYMPFEDRPPRTLVFIYTVQTQD